MRNKLKKILTTVGVLSVFGLLASCNSFCDTQDLSSYRFGYDPLNVKLFDSREDALYYAQTLIPDGYETVTLDTTFVGLNGEETLLISNETFKDTNLYYIHSASIGFNSLEENSDGVYDVYVVDFSKNDFIIELESSADTNSIKKPSGSFYEGLDYYTLEAMLEDAHNVEDANYKDKTIKNLTFKDLYGYSFNDYKTYLTNQDEETLNNLLNGTSEYIGRYNSLLVKYGFNKFYDEENQDYYANISIWNELIGQEIGSNNAMNNDFFSLYQTTLTSKVSNLKTCISITDNDVFGHVTSDPLTEKVIISNKASDGFFKSWGKAFKEHGFLEGLLVYPIAYSVESLSHSLGMNGWGQIFAVLIVTVVIRLLFSLITFKSTLSQQKMTYLQPEIVKLQQKYPNANTNEYDKQRLAQAQMALYKKHGVKPLSSLLIIIIQLPLFICVWNAMQGSASLSSDSVLGLYLSETIWNTLKDFSNWPNATGWWTALVLILLMSAGQIISMLLPQWINKKRSKNVTKTVVSNSQNDTQSQTKMFSYIMTGMVIIMGFTLPSAMGVYWFAGALFSIGQTLLTQRIIKKKGFVK